MSILASMAAFALATSITPGPVNVVALGSGARHGFAASLVFVRRDAEALPEGVDQVRAGQLRALA